ncbi:hypothetical protein [Streptomyces spiralis]|uniref:hypothetical protein n=1 Tax=Streptomyces spiralis TaxID=66376 RepID=UPI001E52811C|nr:hypothetical protein [Streptomyces spiralis]
MTSQLPATRSVGGRRAQRSATSMVSDASSRDRGSSGRNVARPASVTVLCSVPSLGLHLNRFDRRAG